VSKKLAVLVAAALMALMTMVIGVMPAFAQEWRGPSACKYAQPGLTQEFITAPVQSGEFSGTFNPGNANIDLLPLVPFGFGCNPNATD